jgi:hypothetical protein
MTERWQRELTKLRGAEPPAELWERATEGPRLDPLDDRRGSRVATIAVAAVLAVLAAILVLRAFGPLRAERPALGGPDVLPVPARGETLPAFLPDGRPIFVVHHDDGTVTVADGFSSHRPFGFEEVVVWCPTTRDFVEWAHEAHYDEHGIWYTGGPAYADLATFDFDVVDTDANGDPSSIRVGEIRVPDPDEGGSAPTTDPSTYPPLCPPDDTFVTHTIDPDSVYASPEDAVAASPEGWALVRATLHGDPADGFVQLCAEVVDGRCVDGVPVRGLDNARFMVDVVRGFPGRSGYEEPQVWLVRVRGDVIDDPAGVHLFHGAGGGVHP